jgi:hypothetical protein
MKKEGPDKEFWERADEIILLANKQCEKAASGKVSSSLLYASSRFSAFLLASTADDGEEMKKERDKAIKYFTDQYKNMLIDNLDDYIENHKEYFKKRS